MKKLSYLILLTCSVSARIGQTSKGGKLILPNPFLQENISYGKAGLPLSHKKIAQELQRLQEKLALQRHFIAQGYDAWQEAVYLHKRTKQVALQIKKLPHASLDTVQQLDATVTALNSKITELRFAGLNREIVKNYSHELDELVPQLKKTFNDIIA